MNPRETSSRDRSDAPADGDLVGRVTRVVTRYLADRLGPDADVAVAPDLPLSRYRLDSLGAARLVLELGCAFDVTVPMEWLAECDSIDSLAGRVVGLVQSRSSARDDTEPSTSPAVEDDRYAPFPLTDLQQAYVMGKQADLTQDAAGCHLYREFELPDVDVDRLEQAWQRLISQHETLRIVLTDDGSQRIQAEPTPWTLSVNEIVVATEGDYERHLLAVRERMSRRVYDVGEWPLFAIEVSRSNVGRHTIHFSIDAAVTDGHGLKLLFEQWWECYQHGPSGLPAVPVSLPVSLRHCVLELESRKQTSAYKADLEYWLEKLERLPRLLPRLPGALVDHQPLRPAAQTAFRRIPLSRCLSAPDWNSLCNKAALLNVSPSSFVLTLFCEALHRHLHPAPLPIVITGNNRALLPEGTESVAGPFTTTRIFIADESSDQPLDAAAAAVHQQLWRDLGHNSVSAVSALRELRAGGKRPGAVDLPIVFTSMLEAGRDGIHGSGFGPHLAYMVNQTSGVGLEHQMWEEGGELRIHWDVADELFPPGVIENSFAAFVNALTAAGRYRDDGADGYPLNELQKAYYVPLVTAARTGADGCQVYHSFRVASLDLEKLETAWVTLLARHAALHSFVTLDGRLSTVHGTPREWRIPVTHTDADRREALLADIRDDMSGRGFSLGRWPQFEIRVTRDDSGDATVHCAVSLLIVDGRSIHLLLRELFRLYADMPPILTSRPVDEYPGHGLDLHAVARQPQDNSAALEYWQQKFAALPSGPTFRAGAAAASDRRRVRLEGRIQDSTQLEASARAAGVSVNSVLLAALAEACASRVDRPFGLAVVRWHQDEALRPGEYTQLAWVTSRDRHLPLLVRAAAFEQELEQDADASAVSGLGELRKQVMKRRGSGDFGFPVVFTSVLELTPFPLPGGVESGPWMTSTPDVSLDCIAAMEGHEIRYWWDAVEEDFEGGALQELFATFGRILERVDATSDSDSDSERERRKILVEWNATAVDFPDDHPVHVRFEERARECPEAIALRCRSGTMTFAALDAWANRIAWTLRRRGVGPGTTVGVSVRRSPAMVAAVFAVLKAGGAYVPIEPWLPETRARVMMEEAGARLLLTTSDTRCWQAPADIDVLSIDSIDEVDSASEPGLDSSSPPPVATTRDTAYVIFTSGSTGTPKGVAVTHRAVNNLLNWCYRTFRFNRSDVGLAVASLGFDLSVFDLFGLLGAGAGLYIADEEEQKDPQLLLDILVNEPITFWNSAPATFSQVVPLLPPFRDHPGTGNLRLMFLSGDYTPLTLPAALRAVFRHVQLISLGGATEATVWSNYYPVADVDPSWRSIPYGRPIDNCRYYILDASLEPCPVDVEGDLYIAGECLGLGYVNQPALTAERFIEDPFDSTAGARMYKTGDRASYFPDGNIRFLGRTDSQVKIRGFRVELGDIEHCLRQHPAVRDAIVIARGDDTDTRQLVAYVIAAPTSTRSVPGRAEPVPGKELRSFAAERLPDYMVPNFVATVPSFPLTPSGKLDRKALPWPIPASTSTPEAFDAEQLSAEIGALFCKFLGVSQIDVNQDLWDQGASSFTMVQVSNALRARYQQRVPVSVLVSNPTVAGIAAHLAPLCTTTPTPQQPESNTARAPQPDAPAPEFFSAKERAAFKKARHNLRPSKPGERIVSLRATSIPPEHYGWRGTCRNFANAPVSESSLSFLLGLLRMNVVDEQERFLFPSAGETYAVQTYVAVRPGGVESLEEGIYYYNPREHALHAIGDRARIDRSVHFHYNRPLFDQARFELYLIGHKTAIEPIYGEDSERFLLLEAGYMGQLLMMGQASCQIGLCPIGSLAYERIRPQLNLGDEHCFLQAFLGGVFAHPTEALTGERPFLANGNHRHQSSQEIAVIGMAGRYADALNPEALWRNLVDGASSIRAFPEGRDAGKPDADRIAIRGGYLPDIDRFDALLFHISPREAATLDPQMRLLLETTWECLENAGYTSSGLARTAPRVGVFLGCMWSDYQQVGADAWAANRTAQVSGSTSDIANRISHYFDFRGPSVAVNTSCSSSLAALHLAAESLRRGECDVALVAAVNLFSHPYHLGLLSDSHLVTASAPGGAFDGGSTGWSPGEGVGVVLLRPVSAAIEQRDVLHGIIEASRIGHSGHGSRLGALEAQPIADSISTLLTEARLTPKDIHYVECAATGASLADAAEIDALHSLFHDAGVSAPVPVGTIKPNIGHLEAASGLSQLTKVLLQLQHGQIAPTLLSEQPNPLIAWEGRSIRPAGRMEPWVATNGPRRAVINAIGATGNYAHVVVSSPPARRSGASRTNEQTILLSADSHDQLLASAARLRDFVRDRIDDPGLSLTEVAFTLQTGRTHLRHRLAVLCADRSELPAALDAFLRQQPSPRVHTGVRLPGVDDAEILPPTEKEAVALWIRGAAIQWDGYWDASVNRVALPTYPFAQDAHWLDSRPSPSSALPSPSDEATEVRLRVRAEEYLTRIYSEESGIPADRVHASVPLEQYGLNSQLVLRLTHRLEREFGRLSPTLFFELPSLSALAGHLAGLPQCPWRTTDTGAVDRDARTGNDVGQLSDRPAVRDDDVAIVGMAGRFPDARELDAFWENLRQGRDSITDYPAARRRDGWPAQDMRGGFLDDVDCFDPLFFNITPREARLIDPQERLFLEVVWEALEDAGYTRARLHTHEKSMVGVYVGLMHYEYPFFGVELSAQGTPADSGSCPAGIANRVSYFLDLHGPSLAVDTMCSSSLTSIHLAVESLRRKECSLAIAGGVNLSLHPNKFAQQQRLHMSSRDGRCHSFGADASGFAPGEGIAAILLKPLRQAVADGDVIHAVIKGTGVNHGGKTNGYTVPSPASQADLIGQVLQRSGIDAGTISYLEAHGTGTVLGDPVEIEGLSRAFSRDRVAPRSCAIGSVKSNIGHLEGAAGIAGLIKIVLQMKHRQLAPSLGAERLNPHIDWDASPFVVQRTLGDWPMRGASPRRAGVSAFGAGGSNAHVLVEAYDAPITPRRAAAAPQLIVLSARDDERLRESAGRLAAFLRHRDTALHLEDVAYTLQAGRDPMRARMAFVASDLDDLCGRLDRYCRGEMADISRGDARDGDVPPPLPSNHTDLESLAHHWVSGGTVDWDRLHEGGDGRRIHLPSYPFARMRCWVDTPVQLSTTATPVATASPAAIATPVAIPVFEKAWIPDSIEPVGQPEPAPEPAMRVVCLYHGGSERIAHELARTFGGDVVLVRDGGPAGENAFSFSFEDRITAARVMDRLLDTQEPIHGWIDLCDLHRSTASDSWAARCVMLQRLLASHARDGLRLLHVSQGLQHLPGAPPSLAGARMASLIRSLPGEYQHVTSIVLDTDAGVDQPTRVVEQIRSEWACQPASGEICYRAGLRYRPRLNPVTLRKTLQIDADRAYVITGGTRGLGALVADFLVGRGARKLALLGYQPVPDRAQWADLPATHPAQGTIAHIRRLEEAGAQVLLFTGSLTDRDRLGAFLNHVRASFGELGGVVHCAGRRTPGHTSFIRTDLAALESTWEAKVEGLEVLTDLCSADRLSFFVLFSSMSAVAPRLAAGIVDYAAANAYMDFFAGFQARVGRACFHSVNWPVWRDAGAGQAAAASCAQVGLDTITNEQGLAVLECLGDAQAPVNVIPCPALSDTFDAQALLQVRPAPALLPKARIAAPRVVTADAPPTWLVDLFADCLAIPRQHLDPRTPFGELGVESVMLGELLQKIEAHVGRPLEPSVLLDNPTLDQLGQYLSRFEPPRIHDVPTTAPTATMATPAVVRRIEAVDNRIAVIGTACRFPGAEDMTAFWNNLLTARCSVVEVPESRWDKARLYQPEHQADRSISKWGGFVDGIELFDPDYFGMSDDEATWLDPAIRQVLECTVACFHDAGCRTTDFRGRDVGVFVGARMSSYRLRGRVRPGSIGLGMGQNFIAARLSHQFDFHGPNLIVDSACSSSLVSVQLACRSLLAGESEVALAGGADILLDEQPYLEFSAAKALSPSGRCAVFDAHADGFVPGEGTGLVLLKPLAQALRDGDPIHAVIDAVAVNNDGHTMGLTTPSASAQSNVVRQCLRASGFEAGQIGMIEAHGTGTMIGDPIELRALTDVFRETTRRSQFCAIGSVKSNLGHLLSAAGIAGLLKAILSVEHGQIAPTLFCATPNPRFEFASSPFFPNTGLRPWPEDQALRVAGVSAFGLGGTNAHAIVSSLERGLREAFPQKRTALTGPAFRRKRLWLERETVQVSAPASPVRPAIPRRELVSSLLQLTFEPSSDASATTVTSA